MEKLDKVVAALECCRVNEDEPCEVGCPYNGVEGCVDKVMLDALEVLKELRSTDGDLISRSSLMENIEGTDWYTIHCGGRVSQGAPCEEVAWYKATDIYAAINSAPAVDAEPIVRCKECELRTCEACLDEPDDGYCHHGERKAE